MPIRITGMNSGLDTESIITALTQRHKDKLDNLKGDQKKLTWKQDKWKELNKKVASFYNGTLANMRFSTAYTKKVTTASKPSAATVVTGSDAMNTDQQLDITSLAKAAYLTGDKVTYTEGGVAKNATKATTMSELGLGDTTLEFKIGKTAESATDSLKIDIAATDTIDDVLGKLRNQASDAGVNMDFNYDEANNRFYVSAKNAGEDYNFYAVSNDASKALGFDSTNYIKGSSAAIKLNGRKLHVFS